MNNKKQDKGVSPVIGLILVVAITVILSAVIGIFVFDINVSDDPAYAGVNVEDGVVTLIDKGNADKVVIKNESGSNIGEIKKVGGKISNLSSGNYNIIAVKGDTETVIYDNIFINNNNNNNDENNTNVLTGKVSVNPPIEGATVKIYKNNSLIEETTTNSSGIYTINSDKLNKGDDVDIDIKVNNFNHPDLNAPYYAKYTDYETTLEDNMSIEFGNLVTVNNSDPFTTSHYILNDKSPQAQIHNIYQLAAMKNGLNYHIKSDIDASVTKNWNNGKGFKPISGPGYDSFSSSIYGHNHSIDGLYINRDNNSITNDDIGFIEGTSGNTQVFKNFDLINVEIYGDKASGLIGGTSNYDTFKNIKVTGYVEGSRASSLVVNMFGNGDMSNVKSSGTVKASGQTVGGIVANSGRSTINDVSSSASVEGNGKVGGLVGWSSNDDIKNSHFTGSLTLSGSAGAVGSPEGIGGIVGLADRGSVIDNAYVETNLDVDNEAQQFYGGLVGNLDSAEIKNSYVNSDITGYSHVGGLVGKINKSSTVTSSYTKGSVSSTRFVGGIATYNYGTITDSYSTSSVTADKRTIGGLVGRNTGIIKDSYASNTVEETDTGVTTSIGGISGDNSGEILRSYSTGSVISLKAEAGGITGWNVGGLIKNSYSRSSVSINDNSFAEPGGLVGAIEGGYDGTNGKIENSYSTGSVSGGSGNNGLIGEVRDSNNVIVNNGYWDTESSGQDNSPLGTGLTTSEMTGSSASSNMAGFDFSSVWETVSGDYPKLR